MEAKELVFTVLKNTDEPLKAGQIAAQTGIDKKEVDKAIKDLKKEELISSPKRCYYAVK